MRLKLLAVESGLYQGEYLYNTQTKEEMQDDVRQKQMEKKLQKKEVEEAKKKEKKYTSASDEMSRIPKNLPSLLYAEKLQKKAKKVGFDWDCVDDAFAKVVEESEELKSADDAHRQEEAGDLLFAVVNVLRFYKIDPEMALHEANLKFYRRFCAVEKAVKDSGREMKDCTLEELDSVWNEVKLKEKSAEQAK